MNTESAQLKALLKQITHIAEVGLGHVAIDVGRWRPFLIKADYVVVCVLFLWGKLVRFAATGTPTCFITFYPCTLRPLLSTRKAARCRIPQAPCSSGLEKPVELPGDLAKLTPSLRPCSCSSGTEAMKPLARSSHFNINIKRNTRPLRLAYSPYLRHSFSARLDIVWPVSRESFGLTIRQPDAWRNGQSESSWAQNSFGL